MSNYIRLFKPAIDNSELKEVKKVFKRSWLGFGPLVNKFEKKWNNFIGTKYSVGLNSCTAALHLAVAVNNFKKKKKILVPSITFSASAASVLYCDLIPVFVDVNPKTLTICFKDLQNKYTKDCVAVIPVHLGGHPCQMEKIIPWANKKKLIVIEDCAETCGGEYLGKKLGTWGDFGCFSFEEKKIMTTGDGGMLITKHKDKYEKIKSLRFHGWSQDPWQRQLKSLDLNNKNENHWYYAIDVLGFKYNMNDLMASIGLSQLKKLNWINVRRAIILKKYLKGIEKCQNISPTFPYKLKKSSYWLFSVKCKKRDKLIQFLKKKGIATGVHFMPLPLHPLYKKYNKNIKNSLIVWKEIVSLPFFPELKDSQIKFIIKSLCEFDKSFSR
jgi:perosamine synthetase